MQIQTFASWSWNWPEQHGENTSNDSIGRKQRADALLRENRSLENPELWHNPHINFDKAVHKGRQHRRVNIRDLYGCLKLHGTLHPILIRRIFREVVDSIYYLHRECGVSHGDVKPQNILIDAQYRVKITDFSAMKITKDGNIRRFAGAPMFGAPEAMVGNFDGELNDIW